MEHEHTEFLASFAIFVPRIEKKELLAFKPSPEENKNILVSQKSTVLPPKIYRGEIGERSPFRSRKSRE